MDLGCFNSHWLFPTTQDGSGMSSFPLIIPYNTGWIWDVLIPTDYSLQHRMDLGCLNSHWLFPTTHDGSGMSYYPSLCPVDYLLISDYSMQDRGDSSWLISKFSVPISHTKGYLWKDVYPCHSKQHISPTHVVDCCLDYRIWYRLMMKRVQWLGQNVVYCDIPLWWIL